MHPIESIVAQGLGVGSDIDSVDNSYHGMEIGIGRVLCPYIDPYHGQSPGRSNCRGEVPELNSCRDTYHRMVHGRIH